MTALALSTRGSHTIVSCASGTASFRYHWPSLKQLAPASVDSDGVVCPGRSSSFKLAGQESAATQGRDVQGLSTLHSPAPQGSPLRYQGSPRRVKNAWDHRKDDRMERTRRASLDVDDAGSGREKPSKPSPHQAAAKPAATPASTPTSITAPEAPPNWFLTAPLEGEGAAA